MIPQNVCFFVDTNMTANFLGFLLLPGKLHADVINGLQYRVAKMQTKSEMYAKYGHAIYFGEKYDYKNRLSIKTATKIYQRWSIFKMLSLICTINF